MVQTIILIISALIILAVLNRFTEEKRYHQCRDNMLKDGPIAVHLTWCSIRGRLDKRGESL